MIEFGTTLRKAREAKGYTHAQLAEMTRLSPTTVKDLEQEDFSRIAAPIYGRGFIKLYCEAVGIDPKPLVDEFTAIYNGERDSEIRERPVAEPTAEPQSEPSPEPIADPPPTTKPDFKPQPQPTPEPDLFHQDIPQGIPTNTDPLPEAPPVAPRDFLQAQPTAQDSEPTFSRYATPLSPSEEPRQRPFGLFSFWRIGVLGIAALILLTLLGFGLRSLYRATAIEPDDEVKAVEQPSEAKAPAPAAPQKAPSPVKRTPQKIPSLYID